MALQGNLQTTLKSREQALLKGLRAGTVDTSSQLKTETRRDITRAGFPRRVATTMRDKIYPAQGLTFNPAALIYSTAPHIISSHADGGRQRPKHSEFLAVPISDGPASSLRQKKGISLIETFKARFGEDSLQFVKRPGKAPILVARLKASAASGRFRAVRPRKATKTRGSFTPLDGLVTVPVFTLVRSVNIRKRLKVREIFAKGARRHPARLSFHLQKQLAESNRKTAIR